MDVRQTTTKKLFRHLVPLMMILYFLAFIDRANVSIAALTMNKDLGISAAMYGLGAGVFFISYFMFEVPSNIVLAKIGARIWITRILVTWGLISVGFMFVQNAEQLLIMRFLLGAAEAGLYPGMVYYIGQFFPANERTKAITYFHSALPISLAVGNILGGMLLQMDGIMGIKGWQWLFLIEGIPTVLMGLVTIKHLHNGPKDAPWLTQEEKTWLINELEREKAEKPMGNVSVLSTFKYWETWVLTSFYLLVNIGFYGILFWLPQIVKKLSGASNMMASFYSGLPWIAAVATMYYFAHQADKSAKKKHYTYTSTAISGIALVISGYLSDNPLLAMLAITVCVASIECAIGPFWTFPTRMFHGAAGASVIATIGAIGNLGGFIGPSILGFLVGPTGGFQTSLTVMAAFIFFGGFTMLLINEDKLQPKSIATTVKK